MTVLSEVLPYIELGLIRDPGDINSEFRVSRLLGTNSTMVQLWQNIKLASIARFCFG